MTLFEELNWRGLIHQVTHDELPDLMDAESLKVYAGFDATADSLHIGSLVPIMGLVHCQRRGHTPIVLVGGATGLIGDPSGKSEERPLLGKAEVEANVVGIRAQLEQFLSFDGPNAAIVVNNADWLCAIPFLDFLRDVGKHFTVNVMMGKDSVRQRLNDREHGMSFTEFAYSLLQAYDFLHLSDTYDCRVQIGGRDQWGNIVAGTDLIRRVRAKPAFGVTFPLLTKADGSKFGKSESGNVWLSATLTSPYKFYQFWLNQADADVDRWLRYFTFLTPEETAELERQTQEQPGQRGAQKRLAEEVTRLVHGSGALDDALRATRAMFGGDLEGLDDATLEDVFSEVPSSEVPRAILGEDRAFVDILVETGVFKSKGEARRLIQNNGLYINNERVVAADLKLTEQCLCSERIAVIRKGKKNYHLLKFMGER